MKKSFRYLRNGFLILLGVLLVLYIGVFTYVTVNKQKIIKQVTEEVSKKLNGKVTIENVELSFFRHFPTLSVVLHEVSINDTMFAYHHHPFFHAENVSVNLGLIGLIKKKSFVNGFRIEEANFYLFTDTSGYSNSYLLNPKKDSSSANSDSSKEKNLLKSIILKQVRFTIDDKRKQKFHDVVINNLKVDVDDKDSSATLFSAKADILVHSLAFNLSAGSFIKEKKFTGDFDLRIDKKLKQLQFDSINIAIGRHPFNVTGRFDLVKPDPQFTLRLHTRKISFEFAKALFTDKIATALSIVDINKKIDADADISGPLNGGDPLIYATWAVKNTRLITPFLDFDDATFNGFYSDEVVAGLPRRDPNSKIIISNFSAGWQGFPITSDHMEVLNLSEPLLTCDLQSHFPLTTLNDILGSNSLQLQSGDGSLDITYKGAIEKNNNTNSFVDGAISFKNGNVLYAPRGVEMKNVNGLLLFKRSDVFIQNLQCNVFNNKIIMNGEAKNLLTLINTEPNKVRINYNIYSPSLNMESFTYLLKSRKKVVFVNKKNKLGKIANMIDKVLDEGSLDVTVKAGKLLYKKFEAENVTATVSLLQDSYVIDKASMQHAGGKITLNGSLITQRGNYHLAKVNVDMDNVGVSKVFTA
ncbi:MAG: AsmA family protein, partial [Ginsengibacter sp.]